MDGTNGEVNITIVASKTKVAPVQPPTLPRLELIGGQLAVKLDETEKTALSGEINISTHFWTDSMVSLHWVQGDASCWKQYVANRLRFIQPRITISDWRFVAGKENPADLCSRGVSATDLVAADSIWWTGLSWLMEPREDWPTANIQIAVPANPEIDKERKAHGTVRLINIQPAVVFNIQRYSTLTRVLYFTAYILRELRNVGAEYLIRQNSVVYGTASAK